MCLTVGLMCLTVERWCEFNCGNCGVVVAGEPGCSRSQTRGRAEAQLYELHFFVLFDLNIYAMNPCIPHEMLLCPSG